MATSNSKQARLIASWSIYHVLNSCCFLNGGMSLVEYSMLLRVCESETGVSSKRLDAEFSVFCDYNHYADSLLEKELVIRTRDVDDRRALALKGTNKAFGRIELLDKCLIGALHSNFESMTETAINELLGRMDALADDANQARKPVAAISAEFLVALSRYERFMTIESSRFSMSAVQMVALAGISSQPERDAGHFDYPEGFNDFYLEVQCEELCYRGLLEYDEGFVITESGQRRLALFFSRVSARARDGVVGLKSEQVMALSDLWSYMAYLFC